MHLEATNHADLLNDRPVRTDRVCQLLCQQRIEQVVRNNAHSKDSRRQVQRRFTPGSLGVNGKTCKVFIVVGWKPAKTTVLITGTGQPSSSRDARKRVEVSTHEAVILIDDTLHNMNWEAMAVEWTLEEWETS